MFKTEYKQIIQLTCYDNINLNYLHIPEREKQCSTHLHLPKFSARAMNLKSKHLDHLYRSYYSLERNIQKNTINSTSNLVTIQFESISNSELKTAIILNY